MTPGWFDSHCHVQERYLGDDGNVDAGGEGGSGGETVATLVRTLRRARAEAVEAMVCVGTDPAASHQALALARAVGSGELGQGLPEVWATVGQHPHEAAAGAAEVVALVEELVSAREPALVAVGECGLDYHYEHSPRAAQRSVFAEQVALARRLALPLVVHAREAWDDLFGVLASEGVPERSILHCFTGGPEELRRCLDAGMVVSFSGIVTFKNAEDVRQAARLCPLDRMLVETDSPFLAPVPLRGRRNEPANVALVGQAVAALKGCPSEELAARTAANARAVFALSR